MLRNPVLQQSRLGRFLCWLNEWEYTGPVFLVAITLILHFSTINHPSRLVFDEQHYVPDIIGFIKEGEGTVRVEHPPFGKLLIMCGMFIFGENTFGWRFFSVIFGAIGNVFFYLICRHLEMPKRLSFLATFILAFENMTFVLSGVGMLDVFSWTFMLGAFWLYLRRWYIASGVSVGLAALSKLTGALALPVIMLHWITSRRGECRKFAPGLAMGPISFLLLMPLFDFIIWREFMNPFSQIRTMFEKSSEYTFGSASSPEMLSRAWDWILHPEILTFYDSPNYVAMISPGLWALIIPAVCYLGYRTLKRDNAALFALGWFTVTYMIWIPVNLWTDRISYVYYFYPTIGSICIGLALGLMELENASTASRIGPLRMGGKALIPGFLLIHLIAFVILIPVTYWWKVPFCIAAYVIARRFLYTEELDLETVNR